MKEEKRKDDAPKSPATPPTDASKSEAPTDPAAPKPKYVFKIVPADPKNTLDFEDTADK
ncbi:MAG: hypothetical protein K8S98_09175 [Planctomycetes bacterium]|nr:hypothetical protein [Planctomycetota bacterium]